MDFNTNNIASLQNSPQLITLLKASSVAYKKAKSIEFTITWSLAVIVVGYPLAYIIFDSEELKLWLFRSAFIITVATWFLASYLKMYTKKGAVLKEEFDTKLFDLPWRFMLKKIDPIEINKLAGQYRAAEPENWYPSNISPNIPRQAAIALCHRVGCTWDAELRTQFNRTLSVILIVYISSIFILVGIKAPNNNAIFLLFFSSLTFITHFLTLIRGNTTTLKRREEIAGTLHDSLLSKKFLGEEGLRDVQDELLTIRQEPSKVPDSFCSKHNPKISKRMESYVETINKLYSC